MSGGVRCFDAMFLGLRRWTLDIDMVYLCADALWCDH